MPDFGSLPHWEVAATDDETGEHVTVEVEAVDRIAAIESLALTDPDLTVPCLEAVTCSWSPGDPILSTDPANR